MPGFGVLRPNRTMSFFGVYVCMMVFFDVLVFLFWCLCLCFCFVLAAHNKK